MKKKNWLLVGILAVVTFLLGLLANSIMNRSHEAEFIAKGGNNLKTKNAAMSFTNRSTLVSMTHGKLLPIPLSALSI